MTLTGLCPAMGEGWLFFHPVDEHSEEEGSVADTTLADVQSGMAALNALRASDDSSAPGFHWADTL